MNSWISARCLRWGVSEEFSQALEKASTLGQKSGKLWIYVREHELCSLDYFLCHSELWACFNFFPHNCSSELYSTFDLRIKKQEELLTSWNFLDFLP